MTMCKDWILAVDYRLAQLANMEENWDSHGARQIDMLNIDTARYVARLLFDARSKSPSAVVPTVSGSVQFEWHLPCGELEVTIGDNEVHLFLSGLNHDREKTISICDGPDKAIDAIVTWLKYLAD